MFLFALLMSEYLRNLKWNNKWNNEMNTSKMITAWEENFVKDISSSSFLKNLTISTAQTLPITQSAGHLSDAG